MASTEKQDSPPRTPNHAAAYYASGNPNSSAVEGISTDYNASTALMDGKRNTLPPPAANHPYYTSQATNSSTSTEEGMADDNASISPQYEGIEVVRLNSDTDNDEIPPAYHQLTIGNGDISAEVMGNGRISMFINSDMRIPELEPTFPLLQEMPSNSDYPLLNIVIQVVGSRGDVQPFIALGTELQRDGHKIRLATHDIFESFVTEAGLDFFAIGGDPEELMAYMVNNPSIIPNLASFRTGEITRKRKMILEMLEGCWRSCIEPDPKTNLPFVADAIIANPPSFAHMHCAQALGIPVHLMFTMPWTPTRDFPHPLASIKKSTLTDQKTSNFMSYGFVDLLTWQGLVETINLWRRESLNLEPIRAMMGAGLADYLRIPFTYCWSPSLVPKPKDWPAYIDVCGFFFRDSPDYTPTPELDDFLRAGPPPIYIGFGSIVMKNPQQMTEIILCSIREAGVRAVVSKGWSKLGEGYRDENIIFIDDCPHEWLFQHVSAVIHHGGAGTTACGLRYGRPTAIIPFFGDQQFWGERVHSAGAGPAPIDHKSLDVSNLVAAIRTCLDPSTTYSAQQIANSMAYENGVKEAVKSFHRNLPVKKMRCDLLPQKTAVWRYQMGDTYHLKLSDEAVFILIERKELKMKNLKRYHSNPIEIDHKRWDPLSAGSSTLIDTMIDLHSNGKNLFVNPYREIKKAQTLRKETSSLEVSGIRGGGAIQHHHTHTGAAAAAGAAGKGLGKMSGGFAKGMLLDLPVAMADGFHNMPVLYGDKRMERGDVKDWKSGIVVGGKALAVGFITGFTGIVVDPAKGAMRDGAVGFGKGFVTGTLGVLFKPGAAMLGFVGYPLLGAYKSISSLHATAAESKILLARQIQGSHAARHNPPDEARVQLVLREFQLAKR